MDTGEGERESVWERKREWGRERQTETERRRVVIRTTNIVSKEFSSFNERRILPPQKRSVNRAVPTTMPASQIYLTLETERRLACSPPLLAGSSGHPASGSCSEYPSEWISIWSIKIIISTKDLHKWILDLLLKYFVTFRALYVRTI